MKAAVLHKPGMPLIIEDIADPEPGPGEILIEVKACGVCHTDLHLAAGEWRLPKLPLVLGHEVVGIVRAVGPGVTSFKRGDRAGFPWINSTCASCEYCTTDREALCPSIVVTGFTVDGGYAELVKGPSSHATAVPPQLGFVEAAPIYCAALTPYRALKVSGARVGDTVAIWGVGGLGQYAIQIANAMGARVIAVDIAQAKLERARELGADVVVDASRQDSRDAVRSLGGAHVVVNVAPSPESIEVGFAALRRGGTLVLVGLPQGSFTLPILQTVAKGVRILTSAVGTRQDLRQVLDLAAAGRIKTIAETCRLDKINDVFRRMHEGTISGRVVIELQ